MDQIEKIESCQSDCYPPYDHSHDPRFGNDIKPPCSQCNKSTSFLLRSWGHLFGMNQAKVLNVYKCECGNREVIELFKGQPPIPANFFTAG